MRFSVSRCLSETYARRQIRRISPAARRGGFRSLLDMTKKKKEDKKKKNEVNIQMEEVQRVSFVVANAFIQLRP